jgi:hypothetical protein
MITPSVALTIGMVSAWQVSAARPAAVKASEAEEVGFMAAVEGSMVEEVVVDPMVEVTAGKEGDGFLKFNSFFCEFTNRNYRNSCVILA